MSIDKEYCGSAVKTEFVDVDGLPYDELQAQKIAEETPSPHLQDHQYGQTPCYQVTRRPTQPPPRAEVNIYELPFILTTYAISTLFSSSFLQLLRKNYISLNF